ncbi:MAG: D-alanyl-D-alanine carboxypeptidase/D-alanyl-D-alanine-endopeptidase [Betaproteobacteria bacterium]
MATLTVRRFITALLCGLGAIAARAQQPLPEAVQAALRSAQIADSSFSATVLPLAGGNTRLAHRSDEPMAPASTMKLLTTAVALEQLGPTFRWRTELLALGELKGSTLSGPLYLRGGGDPSLSWQRLQLMLRTLRAQGVRHLRGDLVLDRSYFSPERPDLGAAPFDESPDAYYNVIPDALLLHSNLLDLDLRSDARSVHVQLRNPMQGVQVRSQQRLIDADCKDWDDGWVAPALRQDRSGTAHITLLGTFPRGCAVQATTNSLPRNLFIERSVRALWRELGGSWSGRARDGHAPANAKLLVEQSSDTLADAVKLVNKRSDNAMARTLYLTLGARYDKADAWADHAQSARAQVTDWLALHGINADGLVLDNGSGLSRSERLSARQLAQVLQASARSPWYAELATSLPIAGLDGAMRRRLQGTPAALHSRIKTGSLRDTASVAGIVRDASGTDWVVVGMVNDARAKQGRPALDALILWAAGTTVATAPPQPLEPSR